MHPEDSETGNNRCAKCRHPGREAGKRRTSGGQERGKGQSGKEGGASANKLESRQGNGRKGCGGGGNRTFPRGRIKEAG